jgi:hypothetical protein
VAISPRAIDNTGVGINLNPDAAEFGAGDVLTLTGMFVVSKRVVDDREYVALSPHSVAYLLDKPFAPLEPETIFAPIVLD